MLNDYDSLHNKYFDFCFINCEFVLEFDKEFIANIKNNYFYNTDIINIKRYFLYDIDCLKSRGHKFYNINQLTINIFSDSCNMTYEYYINQLMSMCERKINMNNDRNPHLINSLDRRKIILLSEIILTYPLITNKCV